MKFSKFLGHFFLIVHAIHAFDSHCKNGLCEKTSIFLANDKKQNATLAGYVIITFSSIWNWKQCFNLCLKNCQCLSFNFNEVNTTENCELNDANTIVEPEALREKEGVDYYEPARNYYDMKGVYQQTCPDSDCQSNCCHSAPCQNGGTCRDVCHANKRRCNCACPEGFSGHRCQLKVRSCREILLGDKVKTNGLYRIFDGEDVLFRAYCDFDSEPNFAWTLIMSYRFGSIDIFRGKPLYLDMEVNQDAHQWDGYRLSLSRMQSIRNSSTHWRATCNFATTSMDYRDYIRTSFVNTDFLVTPDAADRCIRYEFVDIRGKSCQNCTVYSPYSSIYDYHIDSWWGNFCDFTARPGGVMDEDNFGFYGTSNSAFGCSSTQASTTEYWIGGLK